MKWIDAGQVGYGRMIKAEDGTPIAVAYGPTSNPDSDAHVRLIVAAPQMRAVLGRALHFVSEEMEFFENSYLPEPNDDGALILYEMRDLLESIQSAIAAADGISQPPSCASPSKPEEAPAS